MGPCTNNRRIQRRGPEGFPPLFLHQTKARRAGKNFFLATGSPLLSKGLDARPPPPSQGLDPALNKIHYIIIYILRNTHQKAMS